MINLNDYLTSSGSYPDRAKSPELTPELVSNANMLLPKVNALLDELGIKNVKISSGFRTSEANAATPNSAKKSNHCICLAIDILDSDGKLDELVGKHDDLLKKYGLWQESPEHTKGWIHLDCKDRGKRDKNVFIP